MLIVFQLFLLLYGFVLLIRCADLFVDSISSLATHFRMSKMAIAMTIAAFATCTPELFISFNSMISSAGDIAISNVLGSSVVNILLIIGMSAFCFPIKVKERVVKKEAYLLLIITTVFALSMASNIFYSKDNIILNRIDALLFVFLFGLFLYYVITQIKMTRTFFDYETPKYGFWSSIFLSIFCLGGIMMGSSMIVEFATLFAKSVGVSQKVITMTVIVIGTSLPELSMTLLSAKKKEYDIAVGNIIGTNIFNIGVVLGLPILIFGEVKSISFNIIDIIAVFLSSLLFYVFAKNDKILSRREGLIMMLVFVLYYAYVLFQ